MGKTFQTLLCLTAQFLVLSGCAYVGTQYSPLTSKTYPTKPSSQKLLVISRDINAKYNAIGIVTVNGNAFAYQSDLMKEMADKARLLGGDAVIRVQWGSSSFDYTYGSASAYGTSYGATASGYSYTVPITKLGAAGLIVRFIDPEVRKRYLNAINSGEIDLAYRIIGAGSFSNP